MSFRVIHDVHENNNLPEEYRYMSMYILDNLTNDEAFDKDKHDIILIEEYNLHYIYRVENVSVWRLIIYDKKECNTLMEREGHDFFYSICGSQIISIYYDPYMVLGTEKEPYFEIYDHYFGDVYRYTFKEYKNLYDMVLNMYYAIIEEDK